MKASDLFIRCLEIEGVRHVFGLPGEEVEDLLFSLADSPIPFVATRHEQGAAFMADIWGRLTGRAGVCLATLGPGATNLLTGLADAHLDKSPVVAITGQGGVKRLHKESHQLIDVVNMFRPIVKWNTSIHDPQTVPEAVRKSFKLAQMEKPGVTHLELPEDVAAMEASTHPIRPTIIRRPSPDYKAVDQAVKLLKSAKKPLIIAGNGAIRKLASKHLRLFVEKTNIPVVSTFMGKGAISDKDEHSLFTIGLQGRDFPLCALEQSDLIITIGYDIAEYSPERWNTVKNRPIIHIDFLPSEVYEHYQPAVEIVADISASLWELNQRLEKEQIGPFTSWFTAVRQAMTDDFASYEPEQNNTITIPGVLNTLRRTTSEDAIIVSDVGAHKMWVGRNFPVYTPGTCIISNGFASMGIAVPGGIAAKLAFPKRQVVAVTGDGGFLMNSQEIETAKRIGVGFTIIIVNDNNYGLITWKQQVHTQKSFGTALTNPDFVKYARSFGIDAYHPKTAEDIGSCLTKVIKSQKLTIVAIDVNPEENLRLSQKLDSNLCANFSLLG